MQSPVVGIARQVYRIDEEDRICAFDVSRPAGESRSEWSTMVGRLLWEFIEDRAVVALYRQIVRRVRGGRRVRFRYRCDSPDARRLYRMEIRRTSDGPVEFVHELVHEEHRSRVEVLDRACGPRGDELLRVCSWCERAALPDARWVSIEEAVESLQLMQQEVMPKITHGICERCAGRMKRNLARPEPETRRGGRTDTEQPM
ncbi:hypothetical protein [Congregicoccus parvus]|uniref:hypothetical protein n=1 Tax=Congregicoccus parvus TaxID=3081749 RepID=UPI003FA53E93